MTEPTTPRAPIVAGRIGVTLLCIYLLAVTVRISSCYAPEPARRDELPEVGPALGDQFPDFKLRDVSGVEVSRDGLAGNEAVIVIVPSLDWSPATKARLLDLADALAERRAVRVAVVTTAAQATPRALAFVRDRRLPFFFLIDDADLIEKLGLAAPAPDGTPAAFPATFVLDGTGRVRLRDVRKQARSWLAAPLVLDVGGMSESASAP
jgi:peroxiredoxin